MKKIRTEFLFVLLISFISMVVLPATVATAAEPALATVDIQLGENVITTKLEMVLNEASYVGLRSLAEATGAQIDWDEEHKAVVFMAGPMTTVMQAGRGVVYIVDEIGGEYVLSRIEWDAPLVTVDDRSYLPAFALPLIGMLGIWDENFKILDVVLSPYVYTDPVPRVPAAEAWKLIDKYWLDDTPVPPVVISAYTTSFNSSEKNRTNNLKQSAAAIDGTVVQPGTIFSFNQVVGPRTPERNYLKAIVYENGKKVEDYGGGVCQVSSTLYNAVLTAGLTVVERHPHGLPVAYVPAGKDATVYYGVLDFRFLNDLEKPVTIGCIVSGDKLTIQLTIAEK